MLIALGILAIYLIGVLATTVFIVRFTDFDPDYSYDRDKLGLISSFWIISIPFILAVELFYQINSGYQYFARWVKELPR